MQCNGGGGLVGKWPMAILLVWTVDTGAQTQQGGGVVLAAALLD